YLPLEEPIHPLLAETSDRWSPVRDFPIESRNHCAIGTSCSQQSSFPADLVHLVGTGDRSSPQNPHRQTIANSTHSLPVANRATDARHFGRRGRARAL